MDRLRRQFAQRGRPESDLAQAIEETALGLEATRMSMTEACAPDRRRHVHGRPDEELHELIRGATDPRNDREGLLRVVSGWAKEAVRAYFHASGEECPNDNNHGTDNHGAYVDHELINPYDTAAECISSMTTRSSGPAAGERGRGVETGRTRAKFGLYGSRRDAATRIETRQGQMMGRRRAA